MRRSSLASSDPYQGVKDVSAFLAKRPPAPPSQAPEAPPSRRSSITGASQGRRGSVTVTPAFQNFRLGPTEVGLLPSNSSSDSERGYKRDIPRGTAERRASLVERRDSAGRRGSAGYTGAYLDAGVAVRANILPRAGADSPSRRPPMPAGRRVSLTLHSAPAVPTDAARYPGRAADSDDERDAGRNSITEIMTRVAGSFRRKPSDQSIPMADASPQGRANLYSNKGTRDRDSLYQYSSGSESGESEVERRFRSAQNAAERRGSTGGSRRGSYAGGRRDSYGAGRRDSYGGARRDSYAGARPVRTPGGRRNSYVSAVTADPAGTRRRESSSYTDTSSEESERRPRRQSKPASRRDRGDRMSRRSTKETDETRPPTERKPRKKQKEVPADEPWEMDDDDDHTVQSHQLPAAPTQPPTTTSAATATAQAHADKQGMEGEVGTSSSDDDSSKSQPGNEEEFAEDFKFVRKTLPRGAISHEEERMEFRCLDYSPLVNVRPVDMKEELRPIKASRKIRLYVCITCYNEDGEELRRTLLGIANNLPRLAKLGVHWSEICVCILLDGRESASRSMVDYLQHDLKVYDPTILRRVHKGRPVVVHVFERSVELPKFKSRREYHYPLQIMLAVKERNGGKLNSHLWFFSGFCVQLNPKYTLLVDVGTIPHKDAIVNLYHTMEEDPQLGGACGEIVVRKARPWSLLDASQMFEYKMSHIMDKAAESMFGYITVLPGAFSIYRWVAIRGEPLCAYFTIEEIPITDLGPAVSNMYLAEDRILCFEILAKKYRQWLLRYDPTSVAETDAPQTLVELIKQRRRWLNGSFFALVYYLYHFRRFMGTSHGIFRKFLLLIQFFFLGSSAMLAWFNAGTLFLSFVMVINRVLDYAPFGSTELKLFFSYFYILFLFLQVIAGLAGKVNQMYSLYFTAMFSYAILMVFSTLFGVWLITKQEFSIWIGISLACSIFSYLIAAAIHGQFFKTSLAFVQYILMIPSFVNVFPVYSFCNMHDISWGTKEGNLQSETRRMHAGKADRALKKALLAQEAIQRLKAEAHAMKRQEFIDQKAREITANIQQAKRASTQKLIEAGVPVQTAIAAATAAVTFNTPKRPTPRSSARSTPRSTPRGSPRWDPAQNTTPRSAAAAITAEPARASVFGGLTGARMTMVRTEDLPKHLQEHPSSETTSTKSGTALLTVGTPQNKEVKTGDFIKVIDEDNRLEGLVDIGALGQTDAQLKMTVIEATAVNQALIGTEMDTRSLIKDARRVAKEQKEAAEREKRLADDLALNRQAMQSEFNYFRIRMLMGWIICNSLFVVLMNSYDPSLQIYASFIAGTVVYTIGTKLIGSCCFQATRGTRWCFRRYCGCCYRIEENETKTRSPVCCIRPLHYYALDDMWETEHDYDHVYPEEIGIDAAEAEQAALANGLTYAGEAPDGTPLYYASDGTGPYDVNGVSLDPTAVGFLLGPHLELLAPDGTPVVDENGLPIIFNPPVGTEFAFPKQGDNEDSEDEESVQILVERDDEMEEESVKSEKSSRTGSSSSGSRREHPSRHESRASNIRHGKIEDDSATGEEVSGDDSYSQYSGSKSSGSRSTGSSHEGGERKHAPRHSIWPASQLVPTTLRANSRPGAVVHSEDVVIDMRTAHTGAAKPPLSARGASFVLTMPTPRIGMDTARSARSDAGSHVNGAGSGLTARDRAGGRFFFPPGQPSPRDSGVSLRSGSTPRQGEHGRAHSTLSQTVSKLLGLSEGESSDSDEEPLPVHNRRVTAPSSEFPIVRINSGTSHRPSQSAPPLHPSGSGARTQDARRAGELYGYHDPVTDRWVPPMRQDEDDGSDVDEDYEEKIVDTMVPGSHNRSLSSGVRHRSGGSNLSNVHEADEDDAGAVEDGDEDDDDDGDYLDLADLLADAEIQSSKVMARQNVNHKTL